MQEVERNLEQEHEALNQLDHPNIIKMINYDTGEYTNKSTGEHYSVNYMILEYAEGGDLFNYVQSTGRFSEKLARHFFLQILNAIKYSHDKNICHRDLKLENIMLDKDYNIKLIDFGF